MALSSDANSIPNISNTQRFPRGIVKINGNIIPGLIEIEVDSNAWRECDTFRVTLALSALQAPYDEAWICSQTTMQVTLYAGTVDDPNNWGVTDLGLPIIVGNVDTIDYNLSARTLELTGRDLTSLLIDTRTAEKWINQSASQIATTLANRHGLTPQVKDTSGLAGGFYQADHVIPTTSQTEWDLLCWLAQQVGFVVYVKGQSLYFGPPPDTTCNKYPITWQPADSQNAFCSNVSSLKFSRTLTVGKTITVTVRTFNQQQRQGFEITYPSAKGGKIKPGSATSPAQNYSYLIPNLTKDQATQRAMAIYNEMIKHEMLLTANLPADSVLDVMHVIPASGTGTAFDQTYYPESINRRLSMDEGYRMSISAKNHSDEVEPAAP